MLLGNNNYAKNVRTVLSDCARRCQHFSQATYIDLIDFLNLVMQSVQKLGLADQDAALLSQELLQGIDATKRAVLADIHGQGYPRAHGLSIYYTQRGVDPDYSSMYWAQHTRWVGFLNAMTR